MALIVLALCLIVRACETGRYAWLLAGAAALGRRVRREAAGVAGRAARAGAARLSGAAGPAQTAAAADARRRRGVRRGRAVVADGDAAGPRPRPPVRDRLDERQRVERGVRVQRHRPARRQIARTAQTVYEPGRHYPVATQSERDHIPIVPPSPTRLLARIGPLSGERLGLELLVALLLGIPALISGVLADRRTASDGGPRTEDMAWWERTR